MEAVSINMLPTVPMYNVQCTYEPIVRNQIQQPKEDYCCREKSRFTEDDNCGNRCQCQLPAPSFEKSMITIVEDGIMSSQ